MSPEQMLHTAAFFAGIGIMFWGFGRAFDDGGDEARREEKATPARHPLEGSQYFVAQGRVLDALEIHDTEYEGHKMTVEPFPSRRSAEIWYLTTMAHRCHMGRVIRRQFISGNWVDVESWPIKQTVQS